MIIEALFCGGLSYAGISLFPRRQAYRRRTFPAASETPLEPLTAPSLVPFELGDTPSGRINRSLCFSSTALGIAASGVVFSSMAGYAVLSVPLSLLVYGPNLRSAIAKAGKARVDGDLLTATRLGTCVVFQFYAVAALDAFLRSVADKLQDASRRDCEAALDEVFSDGNSRSKEAAKAAMAQNVDVPTRMQARGERQGRWMAPVMLGTFFVSAPFYGVNRAASFLMTSFGSHMGTLSPTAVRQMASRMLRQGMILKAGRGLEQAAKINTVILDADRCCCRDGDDGIRSLVKAMTAAQGDREIEFIVLTNDERTDLAKGAHRVLIGVSESERSELIRIRRAQGRIVCFVGDGLVDSAAMENADVSISVTGAGSADRDSAQVVLLNNDIGSLVDLIGESREFRRRQGFSFATPIGCDVMDILTTVFLHFGVLYSALFNYTGLVLSTVNAGQSGRSNRLQACGSEEASA